MWNLEVACDSKNITFEIREAKYLYFWQGRGPEIINARSGNY
jgi:hypothetical protein